MDFLDAITYSTAAIVLYGIIPYAVDDILSGFSKKIKNRTELDEIIKNESEKLGLEKITGFISNDPNAFELKGNTLFVGENNLNVYEIIQFLYFESLNKKYKGKNLLSKAIALLAHYPIAVLYSYKREKSLKKTA